MATALVTGGGGFLGRYIVEQLVERGDKARILARREYSELSALGVDCRQGDLRDANAVAAAIDGCDVVYHVAALAGVWGARDDFFSINVNGTDNVIDACRRHRIPKLVYTSSPSVVFGMDSMEDADETTPYPNRYYAHYPESKAEAERHLLKANGIDGVATCALRPHLIWGPRDTHIVPLIADRAKQGKLVRIGDGTNRVDVTYVENAATAHLQAADALTVDGPVGGQAYFIGDSKPVNLWSWINQLLQTLELPAVQRSISYTTARRIGSIMEAAHTILPFLGEPSLTRFLAAQFATSHHFDHSKAARDFRYAPQVDNDEGMRRTAEWYRSADLQAGDINSSG
jgi:nucleoside-diphosphate-sugar epimerase